MSDKPVPENWRDPYQQCKDFLANPGEPSDISVRWFISAVEELVAVRAALAEAQAEKDEIATAKSQTCAEFQAEASRLHEQLRQWKQLLSGAFHALKSYQYGNAETSLAARMADSIEVALAVHAQEKP